MREPEPVAQVMAPAAPVAAPPPKRSRRGSARSASLKLRILEPTERQGEVHALDQELTVGRGGGCAIVLTEDSFVSQVHARLFQQGGDAFVEDLGSTQRHVRERQPDRRLPRSSNAVTGCSSARP